VWIGPTVDRRLGSGACVAFDRENRRERPSPVSPLDIIFGCRHLGLRNVSTVGIAQSRVTETTRGTCIYSFVLHAPPLALEHVEGALDAQRVRLQSELATLKSLMEQ
jgi:hypothetical protein